MSERWLSVNKPLGPLHPDTAHSLSNLATFYANQRNFKRAEPLYQRAWTICEQVLGLGHPVAVKIGSNYVQFLMASGSKAKAAALKARLESFQAENSQ